MWIDKQALEHYLKFDTWTVKEAALIINGYHPEAMTGRGINVRARLEQIPEEFHDVIRTLDIFLRTDWAAYGYQFYPSASYKLPPIAFLTVAADKQIPIDEDVYAVIREWLVHQKTADQVDVDTNNEPPLKDIERESLYKIVIGWAIGLYAYDPTAKRNPRLAEMRKDIERAGLSIDDDTLRKWLKEAATVLPGN